MGRRIAACGIAAALTVGFVYSQQVGQPADDQQRIVEGLQSQNKGARDAAVAAVLALPPEKTTTAARAALIGLMDSQTALAVDLRARGTALATVEDPELVAAVQRAVANLKDPSSIPALARAMGGTFVTVRPLAQFGERAAPYVLDIVESAESHRSQVYEGLLILRFMIEKQAERPLSPTTLDRIRKVAYLRITGQQHFEVLWKAIDLASALQDDALQAIVRDLAMNPQEAVLRGVVDPSLVERTQQLAAAFVAGRPPLPRPDF